MRTQRTHVLALRAARKVTALSRAARRITLNAAAGALIATSAFGCGGDSAPGTVADASSLSSSDAQAAEPDTAGLMADILGAPDATAPADGADQPDLLQPEEDGWVAHDATTTADVASDEDVAPDVADEADVAVHDVGEPDVSPPEPGTILPETCYVTIGVPCEIHEDCIDAEGQYKPCYEGQCVDQDWNNEVAQECCNKHYAENNFGVPGCNPWGPPAPPVDRGHRLDALLGLA